MTNEDDSKNKLGLMPSHAGALSRGATTSLASRGMQDLLAREDAEQWYRKGLEFWAAGAEEEDWDEAQESYEEAFKCFERGTALNPNHVGLQYYVGWAYLSGFGVAQDFSQAVTWFRRAADQGDADAQYGLGCTYLRHDYSKAAAWYFLAVEQGHAAAAFELGKLFEVGQGVRQDRAHAAAYYRLAAERGDGRAQQALDDMLRKIEQVQGVQGVETSNEYRQPLWKDRSEDNKRRCVYCNTPFSSLVVCYREHLKACAQAAIAAKGAKADMAEIVAGEYGDYGCPYHDA